MYCSTIIYTGQGISLQQREAEFLNRDHLGNTRLVLEETGRDLHTPTQLAANY